MASILMKTIATVLISQAMAGEYVAPRDNITSWDSNEGIRTIGPAAWMCTKMNLNSTEIAYSTMLGYLTGSNGDSKVINDPDTWPILETRGKVDKLCVYLHKDNQCSPPKPLTNDLFHINQHYALKYYGRTFWGQVSKKRYEYEITMLKKSLKERNVESSAVMDMEYLLYWSEHEREVRFDHVDKIHVTNPTSLTRSETVAPVEYVPGIRANLIYLS